MLATDLQAAIVGKIAEMDEQNRLKVEDGEITIAMYAEQEGVSHTVARGVLMRMVKEGYMTRRLVNHDGTSMNAFVPTEKLLQEI